MQDINILPCITSIVRRNEFTMNVSGVEIFGICLAWKSKVEAYLAYLTPLLEAMMKRRNRCYVPEINVPGTPRERTPSIPGDI